MKQLLRLSLVLALVVVCCSLGHANQIFNYSGVFNSDSDLQVFSYTAPTAGVVDAFTTSFADPINGFMPELTLFDSSGAFVQEADATGTPYGLNGISSPTDTPASEDIGQGDTFLTWNATAGDTYYVVLSVFNNPTIDSPFDPGEFDHTNPYTSFTYAPGVNFTGTASGVSDAGTAFWDYFQTSVERNGNWALTISGPDDLQSQELPEPSSQTYLLIGGGMCLLAGLRRRRQRSN